MPTDHFKRKLAAILSADVKGYSRLMGGDEETTVRTITAYREAIISVVLKHSGRVVDCPGDNILAKFASVVDAVRGAVEIQEEIKTRNTDLPDDRKMEFRIGINLGDVIHEAERIYGDGVNVAARVESIAEPGGICISGSTFEQVKNKLPLGYEYLGEHSVKNIAEPVRVYRVLMKPEDEGKVISKKMEPLKQKLKLVLAAVVFAIVGAMAVMLWNTYFRPPPVEVASVEKMAFPLPDKPSIAVLPFDNLSGDPDQEYFSDGLTEDLITDLSKVSGLLVIARNSVFTYKGKAVKIQKVGKELGVRYVLEGSVRKAGDIVRITAQLVDTATQGHLWAERYDRDLKDIFALQDEVTWKIVRALEVELTGSEHKRLVRKYTDNLEAYDYLLRGKDHLNRLNKENNAQAREMFRKAIALDPEYALAYSLLGKTHMLEWSFGWTESPKAVERAFELAKKAIALDELLPSGHRLLGKVYLWKKQHEQSIGEFEKAIALDPNDADGFYGLGSVLSWSGRPEEAIGVVNKAILLNPKYPAWYLWALGHAYFLKERFEDAILAFKSSLDRNPNFLPSHFYLAVSYTVLGRREEAKAEAIKFKRMSPNLSSEAWKERLPYKDKEVLEQIFNSAHKIFNSAHKAGLK